MELFFPNSSEDQKKERKRSAPRIEHFFPQIYTLRCKPIQIIGGDADVDHSQTIGGMQPHSWGDISPIPPCFGTPACSDCRRKLGA